MSFTMVILQISDIAIYKIVPFNKKHGSICKAIISNNIKAL